MIDGLHNQYVQAVGLASTLVPDMEIDVKNPIGMMKAVVAKVTKLEKALEEIIVKERTHPIPSYAIIDIAEEALKRPKGEF